MKTLKTRLPQAFILMPFSPELSWVYRDLIQPACIRTGVTVKRADDIDLQRSVLRDIVEGIILSDLLIADLTGSNANVFYELGAAHALMRPVIILSQNVDNVPFDLRSHRIIPYSKADTEREKHVDQLMKAIQETLRVQYEPSSPIAEYMPIPFASRIVQANRHSKPVGELRLYKDGTSGVLIGKGRINDGLVNEAHFPLQSVNWGSRVTGWGWDGVDKISMGAPKGTTTFVLRNILPTSMKDINGTPYIRTVHGELIYFDLFVWNILPREAFKTTFSGGLLSAIISYPLESLKDIPSRYKKLLNQL